MGTKSRKLPALALCIVMAVTLIPQTPVSAKAAVKLSKCAVTLPRKSCDYTGKAVKPAITVKYKGKKLKNNRDYTVKYANNTKPGTAAVTVKGKGAYSGTVKKTFKIINGLTVSLSRKSFPYTGKAVTPKITVKAGKKKLTAKQYSVKYRNNIKAGTAEIIVTGKGAYKKKKAYITFQIEKKKDDGKAALAIKETSGVLVIGEKHKINVLSHNGKVTFSSNADSIVSVDASGNMEARNVGKADITVKDTQSQKTITVTVVDYDFFPQGMNLHPNETGKIEISRGAGTGTYKWYSDNPSVAAVDSEGTVTAVVGNGGTANICLAVETLNGTGYSRAVKVQVPSITSIYSVEKTDSTYPAAGAAASTLSENQSASINLVEGGLETAGADGDAFWHNTGLSTVYYSGYNYYFVSDTWNNRVLVYKVPEEKTWGYEAHDVKQTQTQYLYCVLGQSSISARKSGYRLNELNWPVDAAAAVNEDDHTIRLFVTDTSNNRILVWNDLLGMEGTFGWAADYSIMEKCDVRKVDYINGALKDTKMLNMESSGIKWPWALWTDGTRLMCTSTQDGCLLIWDELPSKEDKYPDKVINAGGTIRTIACHDNYLLLGDHNIQTPDNRNIPGLKIIDNYTGLNYTTVTDKDNGSSLFRYAELGVNDYGYVPADGHQPSGTFLTSDLTIAGGNTLPKGTLLLSQGGGIEVRRSGNINDRPDYYVGGGVVDDTRLYFFTSADYAPIIIDHSGNMYYSMGSSGIVTGYKAATFPSEPVNVTSEIISQQDGDDFMYKGNMYFNKRDKGIVEKHSAVFPTVWIGAEKATDDAYKKTYRYQNCMVASDGKHLAASSDCGNGSVLMLWKDLPDVSEAKPDVIYTFTLMDTLNDTAIYDNGSTTMLMTGGRNAVIIWSDINTALNGGRPTHYLRGKIGTVTVNDIQSFAYDGAYFYLSDSNGIYIFKGIPSAGQAPVSTLDYKGTKINVTNCDDGKTYLAIGSSEPVIYTRDEALKNGEKYVIKGAVRNLVDGLEGNTFTGDRRYRKSDRCSFISVGDVLVTKEGKVMVSDMGFFKVIIWDSITEAVNEGNSNNKSATRIELGYGEGAYDIYDILAADSTNYYHQMSIDEISAENKGTLYRPCSLAYDGKYLWVGDFKFSGGIRRFN